MMMSIEPNGGPLVCLAPALVSHRPRPAREDDSKTFTYLLAVLCWPGRCARLCPDVRLVIICSPVSTSMGVFFNFSKEQDPLPLLAGRGCSE